MSFRHLIFRLVIIAAMGQSVLADSPRIGISNGAFVDVTSSQPFFPHGFHYIRLLPNGDHTVFAPSHYDSQRIESMLQDLQSHGFNLVRVFVGKIELDDANGLSPKFMDDVCDFLQRCSVHQVHALIVCDSVPPGQHYQQIIGQARDDAEDVNRLYLDPGHLKAKAQYLKDFVGAIKSRDPKLLPVVFAWELENEAFMMATGKPFSTRGTFEFDGAKYDLSTSSGAQLLADDSMSRWADQMVDAIHQVDPDAMVSASAYTFAAVGRSGPGKLYEDKTPESRFPVRPIVLTRTKISYIDIHLYGQTAPMLQKDLASIEWPELSAAAKAHGQPLFMGEFGAFHARHKTVAEARDAMIEHLGRVMQLGFCGWSYWTYDCEEQAQCFNAKTGKGEIFDALVQQAAQ